MTNKQTIDGVSRELLERFSKGSTTGAERRELRALLDKPERPPVADLLLASSHSYVKVAGETQNLARYLQASIEQYFDGEPSAQHQGEPVAFVECPFA